MHITTNKALNPVVVPSGNHELQKLQAQYKNMKYNTTQRRYRTQNNTHYTLLHKQTHGKNTRQHNITQHITTQECKTTSLNKTPEPNKEKCYMPHTVYLSMSQGVRWHFLQSIDTRDTPLTHAFSFLIDSWIER